MGARRHAGRGVGAGPPCPPILGGTCRAAVRKPPAIRGGAAFRQGVPAGWARRGETTWAAYGAFAAAGRRMRRPADPVRAVRCRLGHRPPWGAGHPRRHRLPPAAEVGLSDPRPAGADREGAGCHDGARVGRRGHAVPRSAQEGGRGHDPIRVRPFHPRYHRPVGPALPPGQSGRPAPNPNAPECGAFVAASPSTCRTATSTCLNAPECGAFVATAIPVPTGRTPEVSMPPNVGPSLRRSVTPRSRMRTAFQCPGMWGLRCDLCYQPAVQADAQFQCPGMWGLRCDPGRRSEVHPGAHVSMPRNVGPSLRPTQANALALDWLFQCPGMWGLRCDDPKSSS